MGHLAFEAIFDQSSCDPFPTVNCPNGDYSLQQAKKPNADRGLEVFRLVDGTYFAY